MSFAVSAARPRPGRAGSVGIAIVLLCGVVTGVTAPPALAEPDPAPAVQRVNLIPHKDFPLARRPVTKSPAAPRPATAWPAGGSAVVQLSGSTAPETSRRADLGAAVPGLVRAGDLPVTVGATGAGSVRVTLAEPATAHRAGVTGVLLSLAADTALSTSVGVDYSGFRYAGGADLGSRLRLVRLPACALSTPQVPSCLVQTPVSSHNDPLTQVVTAQVSVPAAAERSRAADLGTAGPAMVLAAVADASGPQGSFEASSLAPSGSWSVTGNSGAFSWSYPITLPPVATGSTVTPQVGLSYGSAGVDGRTSDTNNQTSAIGQGWDYNPGYIERTYRPCADDESLPQPQRTADLCWAGQIVTMNLGGQTVPLVYDDNTHTWHAATDSGARIDLLTGAANGVRAGEHWRVTTPDGVSYWFGRQRGPGYTNQEQTNSAWTVPVYGPRAGCAPAPCTEAWRWNLDFVEDPHGNVSIYYYTPETNFYGANNGTAGVSYVRGGMLSRIDYGLRTVAGSVYGQTVPGQVVFAFTERCVPDAGFSCDPALFNSDNAGKWPDTPQDQQCLAGAVCNNHSPSFWSTKRLTTITTQYNTGGGPVRVDQYQLGQVFPGIGNPELRLDSITHTGFDKDGGSIALPPMQFTSQLYDNRVPGFNTLPAMAHWRLTEIATDTGSIVQVTYSQPDCGPGNMPTDPAHVTKRCFPVYWTPPFNQNPILDYFHKYVVTHVAVQDRNAMSPTQHTSYTYLGEPGWHFDDNEVVKPKHRTYGQFRGYPQVEIRTGDGQDVRTLVRSTYFRGMYGDVLPGGLRRTDTVGNSLGESVPDTNLYSGQVREVQTFNGDGGAQTSSQISDPVTVATTATRARTGLDALTANVVAVSRSRTLTTLAAGGTRVSSTSNRYDALGRVRASTQSGTGLPDLCTVTSYAEHTGTWIRDRASETVTSQQSCPADGVAQQHILAASRTYYDNSDTLGAVPGAGDLTRTDSASANTNDVLTFATTGRIGYDPAGRPVTKTDALGRVTRTAYTPADGGLLSTVVTTNAKLQRSTLELEPARGLTVGTVDVGGRRTDATHDQLGRLTAVWHPGRVKGQDSANVTYAYLQRTEGPLAVTTRTLVDYGDGTNYVTGINLYDGLGQLRQVQADDVSAPAGVSNRVVKDIFYDSHGWQVRSNNRWATTGAPETTLTRDVPDSAVDDRTVTTFDGAGRPVIVAAYRGLTETWNTRTIYGGDRTTVIPPRGGVITTSVTDTSGRVSALQHYTTPPTVNGDVVTGGTFQTSGYQYTALGQLERMTDASGNVWTFGYDLLGRQTRAADPDSGVRTSSYDLAGQLTSTTDARQQTLSYKYDALGRRTHEYSGPVNTGTLLASWTYDTARFGVGRPASSTRFTP
ncbi:MAG TPA: type IV secretion protein Rhs, partial [Actinophytocola sp.]|nr:type IV secretion protein Rhs [Actinophytocola sp.]